MYKELPLYKLQPFEIMAYIGSSNFPNPETDYKSTSSGLGPVESAYCLHFSFSAPEAQDRCREKQQLCHPMCLCNQPYHWFTCNFLCKLLQKSFTHFASMPSSVTYTTWLSKSILILKPWQEFSTYPTIHTDQKHIDLEASAEMIHLTQSFNASMNYKYIV